MLKELQEACRIANNKSKEITNPFLINNTGIIKYNIYIQSKLWRDKKEYLLNKRGCKCEVCGTVPKISYDMYRMTIINIHHKTYERFGNELESDLIILCDKCHKKIHNKFCS